ncbi:MAG: autotransporter outer membrane beta-barrel domain-containing protein [Desulfobacterales bacterium]|nr:autotransporter outer membrane beta-barrel domain-containing protein [Desulfobacterales bacterium]
MLLFFAGWGLDGAHGVPAKNYTDLTLSNENTETVTGHVFWKSPSFDQFAAIILSDTTSYSSGKIFTNKGNVTLNDVNITNAFNTINGIGNDNATVTIRNQGNIYIDYGTSDNGLVAMGIATAGDLENSGGIELDLHRQSYPYLNVAYGIFGSGDTLVNSGVVEVTSESDVYSAPNAPIDITVMGIRFQGNQRIINSGTINVTGIGGSVTGAVTSAETRATGIYTDADLIHTGTISVKAHAGRERPNTSSPYTSDDALAYGIHTDATLTLDSRGLILVEAHRASGTSSGGTATAHQIYVDSGTTTLTGFAMKLDNQANVSTTYNGTIKVDSGAALTFQNTTLYLSVASDFDGQNQYEIPMLVAGAAVADQFTQVGPLPPEYTVSLVNGNGAALQKLKIEINSTTAAPLISSSVRGDFNAQAHAMVGNHILNGFLSDIVPSAAIGLSFTGELDKPEQHIGAFSGRAPPWLNVPQTGNHLVFASPVLLFSKDVSDTGYEAENYGILAGYTHRLRDQVFLGGHAGVNRIDIDFSGTGFGARMEDSDAYNLGLHWAWFRDDQWMFSGILTGFYSQTDYRDMAPTNLESADYDAFAARLDLSLGRLMEWGGQTFLPELGLSGVWEYRDSFETENLTNQDVAYGTMEEFEAYIKGGIQGFVEIELPGEWELFASMGVEVSHALTDNASTNSMAVGALQGRVSHASDKTVISPKLGITVSRDSIGLSAGYSGGYSSDTRNALFWFQMGVEF